MRFAMTFQHSMANAIFQNMATGQSIQGYRHGETFGEAAEHMTTEQKVAVVKQVAEAVDAGKVRQFGLSNETAWGAMMWLMLAREMGAPEVVTIQNEYSLLCRLFDTDLAETCAKEPWELASQ